MSLSTIYLISRKEYVEVPEKYGGSFPLYSLCYHKNPLRTSQVLLSPHFHCLVTPPKSMK